MKPILPLPLGSKITVLDVIYYEQYKHNNDCKDDVLFIIYKANGSDKKIQMIRRPTVEIYFTKPEYRDEWRMPREQIEIEKVYPITCRYKAIVPTIYNELKDCTDDRSKRLMEIYRRANDTGNWRAKKEIQKHQHVFLSDLSITDYYRTQLILQYNVTFNHEVTKAYGDIESDIYNMTQGQINNHEGRVSAYTVIFAPTENRKRQVYTFLLKDLERFPQQEEFLNNLDQFKKDCHKEFDTITITKKGKKIDIDYQADYHIEVFDNDLDLIVRAYEVINKFKPDILQFWNIGYDKGELCGRINKHGKNPVDIMGDSSFPKDTRFLELHIDRRPTIEPSERKTFIKMTSTTKYLDQMQFFAGIRKGGKSIGGFSLDNVASHIAGIRKRTFDKIGTTVINAAIREYYNFILYNINDVIVQEVIDIVTKDSDTCIIDSNTAGSSLENIFKQTIYQKTIYISEKFKKGFVQGNNTNVDYVGGLDEEQQLAIYEMTQSGKYRLSDEELEDEVPDDDDEIDIKEKTLEAIDNLATIYEDSPNRKLTIQGALVGKPNLKTPNGIEIIKGIKSKHFFSNVMDMDYASMYPWVKITRSISRSTQFGRLIIPRKVSSYQNPYKEVRYLPGAEFISDYISMDTISLGKCWFNLPTVDETKELLSDLLGEENIA